MITRAKAFPPEVNADSRLLILGSFPSVQSRLQAFYYGNPRNRFWKILSSFFGENLPVTVPEKKSLLKAHNIALWDVVAECDIDGSKDSSIKDYILADIKTLLQNFPIEFIILNGGRAFSLFKKHFACVAAPYIALPSTSPANVMCDEQRWYDALRRFFGRA